MTGIEIRAAVARAMARKAAGVATLPAPSVQTAQQAVPAVGGVQSQAMSKQDILAVLAKVHGASGVPSVEDGTRVHIHYKAFGTATPAAVRCATRAAELGLPRDRYTGRVHRVWKSSKGDMIVTVWVELERDHMYRTLNLDKGEVLRFVVLGE